MDRPADEPVVTEQSVRPARTVTPVAWSPAQLVGLAVGIGFVVLGIAALAQTGSSHWFTPKETVWRLGHTPLLGWIDIGFGALLILTAVVPGAIRSLMGLLGAAALAFGILILVDVAPARMERWFHVTDTNGWLYVAVGAAIVLAAFFSPVFGTARRVDVRRRDVVGA